jgi:hypothetical protein
MTAALIALLLAATAMAAAPKSGTYKGNLAPPQARIKISMKLSGKRLTHIRISNIPAYCSSGGPAVPVSFPATKLSASHRFTIHHHNKIKVGPLKGKVGEKFTLSGSFNTHGKVPGTLTRLPAALVVQRQREAVRRDRARPGAGTATRSAGQGRGRRSARSGRLRAARARWPSRWPAGSDRRRRSWPGLPLCRSTWTYRAARVGDGQLESFGRSTAGITDGQLKDGFEPVGGAGVKAPADGPGQRADDHPMAGRPAVERGQPASPGAGQQTHESRCSMASVGSENSISASSVAAMRP